MPRNFVHGTKAAFHNIIPDDPPAIVFLGTEDKLIAVSTAETFQQKMQAAGIACELHLYEGQPHGFFNHGRDDNRWYNETVASADDFLEKLRWLPVSKVSPEQPGSN